MESPIKSPFNQPQFNHFNTLTVKEVAGIKDKPQFGFDPYEMPKIGPLERVCGFATGKQKNVCQSGGMPLAPHDPTKYQASYTDNQRVHGWYPTPGGIYVPHSDWKEQFPRRGKFGKYKKMTFTDEVFKYEKDKPSPQKYDTKNWKVNRSPGNFKL